MGAGVSRPYRAAILVSNVRKEIHENEYKRSEWPGSITPPMTDYKTMGAFHMPMLLDFRDTATDGVPGSMQASLQGKGAGSNTTMEHKPLTTFTAHYQSSRTTITTTSEHYDVPLSPSDGSQADTPTDDMPALEDIA